MQELEKEVDALDDGDDNSTKIEEILKRAVKLGPLKQDRILTYINEKTGDKITPLKAQLKALMREVNRESPQLYVSDSDIIELCRIESGTNSNFIMSLTGIFEEIIKRQADGGQPRS